jgi:hypothetical protein
VGGSLFSLKEQIEIFDTNNNKKRRALTLKKEKLASLREISSSG